ncbi:hypothetical protein ACQEVF_45280 [Nonomuraea polychroma]|uniref:hypothetical protein n=1 Tax=Nonomuraea polychroma TaxID=46176 RepID=UPI003D8CACAF
MGDLLGTAGVAGEGPAAPLWLTRVFGFRRHTVIDWENGLIAHAALSLGPVAIVMLGSIQNDTFGLRVPRETRCGLVGCACGTRSNPWDVAAGALSVRRLSGGFAGQGGLPGPRGRVRLDVFPPR